MKMDKYMCPKCGNKKDFYCEVSVVGKIRFNPKTECTEGGAYDIDDKQIDNEFLTVYCGKCGEEVDFHSI